MAVSFKGGSKTHQYKGKYITLSRKDKLFFAFLTKKTVKN